MRPTLPVAAFARRVSRSAVGTMRTILVAVATLLFLASEVAALINVHFTPIHLTERAACIVAVSASCSGEPGMLTLADARAVKGAIPARGLRIRAEDDDVLVHWSDEIGDEPAHALVFLWPDRRARRRARTSSRPAALTTGAIRVDHVWFGLSRKPNDEAWSLTKDPRDLKAVWDGSSEMLQRCVRYIIDDPKATVPVRVGARWADKVEVASVTGSVSRIVTIDRGAERPRALLVLSDAGDRAWTCTSGSRQFQDATERLGIASRSVRACLADLDGDGRADLVSWDGRHVTSQLATPVGTFAPPGATLALDECTRLAALPLGDQRAGALVSGSGAPRILTLAPDGGLRARALFLGDDDPPAEFGRPSACVAADFDGDGATDVVRPFAEGGLFYKGRGDGTFDRPAECGDVFTGEGNASARAADFDGDGRPDIILAGASGCGLWLNKGAGTFLETLYASGEPKYIAKTGCVDAVPCDIDGDGRRDFAVFYESRAPQLFFNRGFACFGFAIELDLTKAEGLARSTTGQQAGMVADLDADGAEDLAMVLRNGQLWVLFGARPRPAAKSPAP